MSIIDKISYYQRNLESCDNEDRILHYISKLYKLPVTVQHLQQTGVGRTVNSFRKYNGTVGDAAKSLVCKWKTMVVDDTDDSSDREDEDETCVIDAHENHTDIPESPKPEDIEEDDSSSNQSSESKYMHRRKEIKSELSTKHSVVHTSKSKSEEKQEKHEKNRHSSKHHSHSERRSKESKSSKSSMTKETHSSTKHSHSKNDDSKKTKATQINEDNNKKRKTSDSSSTTKENKKRKLSDSKSDDEKPQLSISEHNRSQLKASGIQIEVKIKVEDEQFLASDNKQDVKQEKYLQGKSKSSSSKLKSQESDSKAKDSNEKQKHNKEHTSHKKYDAKSFSHSSKETSKLKVSSSSSSNSSSSSKDYIKSKDKDKRKEHKGDKSKYEKKETKIKLIQEINGEGIDCNSGASFAEALGMCSMPQPSKKRQSNSSSTNSNKPIKVERISSPINNRKILTAKSEPECSDDPKAPSLLAPNVKLEPLNVDLASTLPEISPNYKPLPYINPVQRKEEVKPVNDIIYVKNQRTKVYSGNKVGYTSVPTLYEMCIRVLIENIDALEFTGGVPYDILKPILERATADQLFMLEHHNPYLVEDTDILWQYHCNREFRNNERQEMESWREMYMRCLDEREAKLKTLTANIKQSIDKSIPVRSTKLAYVDNVVKPPRNVLKKQAKYGTANAIPATVSSVKKKLTSSGANNATNIAVPPPPMSRFKPSTSSMKKTKAPLMAKALQLIKGRYKR